MNRFLMSVAFALLPVRALSADWYTGAKEETRDDWIVAIDGSVDVTSQGSYFADVNGTFALKGKLDESGPRLRVDGVAGTYSYTSNTTGQRVRGTQETGAALLGYQWVTPSLTFAVFGGADVRNNRLSVADPQNPSVGTNAGVKGSVEFFAQPSALTMVSGYASYATNKSAYFTRLRAGYLIEPGVYVGPEVLALGDSFFNQERIGAHVTLMHLGALQVGISGGYLYDRVRKGGGYASIDLRLGY